MVQILRDNLVKFGGGICVIKFVNKQGKKVMEMTDNGDVKILSEDLKTSFETQAPLKESKEEETVNND